MSRGHDFETIDGRCRQCGIARAVWNDVQSSDFPAYCGHPRLAFLIAIRAAPDDPLKRLAYADYLDEQGARDAACEQRLTVALRGVLEAPDDDAPRLKYAEICEGYGRRERGEFVRVQCELAQLRRAHKHEPGTDETTSHCDTCGRLIQLRARERELLKLPFCLWTLPIQWDDRGSTWEFRRGFIATIRCTAADWLVHGQAILREQPIERVALTDYEGHTLRIHRNGAAWLLELEDGSEPHPHAGFASRAALIDAMPQKLREWGVDALSENEARQLVERGVPVSYYPISDSFARTRTIERDVAGLPLRMTVREPGRRPPRDTGELRGLSEDRT